MLLNGDSHASSDEEENWENIRLKDLLGDITAHCDRVLSSWFRPKDSEKRLSNGALKNAPNSPRLNPLPPAAEKAMKESTEPTWEEEASCSVCLELFTDPVILSCSHNLCYECAKTLVEFRKVSNLECPTCCTTTVLGSDGVNSLKKNITLRNLITAFKNAQADQLKKHQKQKVKQQQIEERHRRFLEKHLRCHYCDKTAYVECEDCDELFCTECNTTFHSTRRSINHKTFVVMAKTPYPQNCTTTSEAHKRKICPQHNKPLSLFCTQDYEVICVMCKTTGKHRDHYCHDLVEVFEEQKEQEKAKLVMLESNLAQLQHKKRTLDIVANHTKNEALSKQRLLRDAIQELKRMVSEKELQLSGHIHELETTSLNILQKRDDDVSALIDAIQHQLAVQDQLVRETDPYTFFRKKLQIESYENSNSAVATSPTPMACSPPAGVPTTSSMPSEHDVGPLQLPINLPCDLDLSEVKQALSVLNFTKTHFSATGTNTPSTPHRNASRHHHPHHPHHPEPRADTRAEPTEQYRASNPFQFPFDDYNGEESHMLLSTDHS